MPHADREARSAAKTIDLWIDGLTISTNAGRLRVVLFAWTPEVSS